MSEYTEGDYKEYSSIPRLQLSELRPGSFLNWDLNSQRERDKLFFNVSSFTEGLEIILSKYPNVLMVRGTDLKDKSNLEAFFSVGGIQVALDFAKRDVHLRQRNCPIILYSPLKNVLPIIQSGGIMVVDHWESHKDMLLNVGAVNLRFSNPSYYDAFVLRKPTNSSIPRDLQVSI